MGTSKHMVGSNPIGPGTVNRTANLSAELDARLGRAVYAQGLRSRSELIRLAVERYLRESAKQVSVFLLAALAWGGAAVVSGEALCGVLNDARRCVRTVRIVRVVSARKESVT